MYDRLMGRLFHSRKSAEKIILCILSITIAIAAAIIFFIKVDRVPATLKDYEELHEQLLMVEDNPEEFMKHKGNITIYNAMIEYKIENNECQMTGKYTRDYKLIEYTQKDKASSLFLVIFGCIVFGYLAWFISYLGIFMIILIGESIAICIMYILKSFKKK